MVLDIKSKKNTLEVLLDGEVMLIQCVEKSEYAREFKLITTISNRKGKIKKSSHSHSWFFL